MTYDQIKPLVNKVMADNMLAFVMANASQDALVKALDAHVRVANDQTDTPQYIPVRSLTAGHVRLY